MKFARDEDWRSTSANLQIDGEMVKHLCTDCIRDGEWTDNTWL